MHLPLHLFFGQSGSLKKTDKGPANGGDNKKSNCPKSRDPRWDEHYYLGSETGSGIMTRSVLLLLLLRFCSF